MIKFQSIEGWEIDLTAYGMTFNESSDYFTKLSQKNYTFPVVIEIDDEISANLGLVERDNISGYNVKIEGYLIVDNTFYDTYMIISDEIGKTLELTFYYGDEILEVFDKTLDQLAFPIIDVGESLDVYSMLQLSKAWPEATHNFPKVYRPQLRSSENYDSFLGFVNNRSGDNFITNSATIIDSATITALNYNAVCPFPYLLEVLKVAFAEEGLLIRGDFVNDELIQKALYIPDSFFDNYSDPLQRAYWSFYYYQEQQFIDGQSLNIYEENLNVIENGTYNLDIKLNFPLGKLAFFQLDITYGTTILFAAKVKNQAIDIDQRITINVANDDFSQIKIYLQTSAIQGSIASNNSFVFDFEAGRVNVFPSQYSLADVMPEMTFRTFYNAIKEFFNLDVTFVQNAVYLNYMDNTIQNLRYIDHSENEIPKPRRKLNGNNLFKLKSPDTEELLVAGEGQVYSDDGFTTAETTTINFSVLPVKVSNNEGVFTGTHPEEDAEIIIGIYDGLQDDEPVLVESVSERSFTLQAVYDQFHKLFLSFRANAETYKDTFQMHVSTVIDLKIGIFKYNKRHIVKSVRKRRVSDTHWRVDQETESF